ncbi:exonuclease SbcCD subunit D [Microbacterium halophytorum]|uniref:exonuclease SbcCD subunit D n=1 Tax=Microbacterium halophytorum TaxID=2067568 RepID=UPI000CFE3037|nr:exonuclease SbcCD subunit D [Microbacterium halophytorum]
MRILHTSDWHIGRSFHGHSTLDALRRVLDALVDRVRELGVDVVVVAGDVFDSAMPAADCYRLLTDALEGIRGAGALVVVTSGNHDSAARLGFQAPFLGAAGVHVVTDPLAIGEPVTLDDEHGPVHFYGIPYLEPALVRHLWPGEALRTQEQVMRHAMGLVNDDRAERGGRSVAIAHCFAAGVEPTPQLEREVRQSLTQGSLDVVPLADFAGPDYVALGHIHGRAALADGIRYSGAPLHYSFGEADKPRGAWLVDLDAAGLAAVEWVDLPVPRRLVTLRGTLDELLADAAHGEHRDDWVCAVLTDPLPQVEPMRKLRDRFPHCATIEHRPERGPAEPDARSYRDRVGRGAPDPQVVDDFLAHVRAGERASDDERRLIADVVSERRAEARA